MTANDASPYLMNNLLILDEKDRPSDVVINQLLMKSDDKFYNAYIQINEDGVVWIHWYSAGNSGANNIASPQVVFGQIEWYVH